jgi:hypothetical protein
MVAVPTDLFFYGFKQKCFGMRVITRKLHMAGELLVQVDHLAKRVERLERAISGIDPGEIARLRSYVQDLYSRLKR